MGTTHNETFEKVKSMKTQKGFTLIELMVVVAILGIIAVVVMSAMTGSTAPANAQAIRSSATELARAVGYLNVNLGTGLDTSTSSVLTGTSDDLMDVLVKGDSVVSTTYRTQFNQLNMRPLEGKIVANGATYKLGNYTVGFTTASCPSGRVCVTYTPVEDEVVQSLAQKLGETYATTANTTGTSLRWTAIAGKSHTITMVMAP